MLDDGYGTVNGWSVVYSDGVKKLVVGFVGGRFRSLESRGGRVDPVRALQEVTDVTHAS